MFRSLFKPDCAKSLAKQSLNLQQTRNTFIVRRRYPVGLVKKGKVVGALSSRHYVYDLLEDTNNRPQAEISIILTKYASGLGDVGDIVQMKRRKAYNDFLLPGLAVYASPENLVRYKDHSSKEVTPAKTYSSLFAEKIMESLSRFRLCISMNASVPWVLEPWHIRCSFRKAGWVVPEHAIGMPPGEIRGPDLSLEKKQFLITVTLNKTEKKSVRAYVHHWGNGSDRLPYTEEPQKVPRESLFPEQADEISAMPPPFGNEITPTPSILAGHKIIRL